MAVSGTPQLNLKIGAENKPANYTRGAGTTLLIFEYAIATGDADTDGISIGEDADDDGISDEDQFVLNNGTITDLPGNPATLTHDALPTQPPHKVDGVVPTIITNGIAITSTDPPYIVGKTISVQATFSEKVWVTGTPQLTLRIGTANRKANYTSGAESTELVFQYTVAEGDRGADGISIAANQLSFNDGTIVDIAGNPAALTHPALDLQPGHKVDAVSPWILANGINISSDAGTRNTYKAAGKILVQVSFNETVHVTNTPQLALKVGTEQRIAAYHTGTGTVNLVFQYTVASGDMDADGIEIGADTLMLNGGMIKDSAGNNATLTHAALPPQASHKVDTTAPGIGTNGVSISSTPSDGTYKTGNSILVTVAFTEPVYVAGTPELTLKIGTAQRTALYASGSGTANLVFEYVVASGDTDTDGIEIGANQVTIPDGTVTITDAGGNPTALTHAALPPQASHKVDSTTPGIVPNGITLMSSAGADNFYIEGDTIQVQVTFSKTLRVTGTPHLALKIGAANRNALYTTGTGTRTLVFEYRVTEGDADTDGMSIERDKLSRNGGTITDAIGNAAVLTHPALPAQASHKSGCSQTRGEHQRHHGYQHPQKQQYLSDRRKNTGHSHV